MEDDILKAHRNDQFIFHIIKTTLLHQTGINTNVVF